MTVLFARLAVLGEEGGAPVDVAPGGVVPAAGGRGESVGERLVALAADFARGRDDCRAVAVGQAGGEGWRVVEVERQGFGERCGEAARAVACLKPCGEAGALAHEGEERRGEAGVGDERDRGADGGGDRPVGLACAPRRGRRRWRGR